ncbi:group III truncated hemoglobin [Mesorhizobium sp. M7A.F.Ca.US.002.01.1.1]|uniref:group III truncated hemoglobin n=1 Tax=Mesorhizobium sp. M7A.F.Ca.US.002.01.1.1 TaxID=2496700 RepID=UPI000FD53178|nr:group III truncated hemoglobin [Mesorhizobium sp. M7A.F.Ca.US.002.01.1.1]RVA04733.1 group III truncated hemoglobin [Mesorhizobium sp. M7A.F.Ca.US.002.01.1.1]
MTQTAPISDEQIRQLVDSFYDKIRADADLRPIFERVVAADCETHLAKMYEFWSSVILTSGFYKGSLVAVRKHMGGLEIGLLDRCLALSGESCDELLDRETAGLSWLKAAHVAESLKLLLFCRPDRPWLRNAS